MLKYNHFNEKNVAPLNTTRIGVYNKNGLRVGVLPLGNLTFPSSAKKLYSFGALSDVHIVYDTATEDFQRALTYFNDNDTEFVCICGDLTDKGTITELQQYKNVVNQCLPNKPVYAIAGNHEKYRDTSNSYLSDYTGKPLYYTVERGNDVFIMVGIISAEGGSIFAEGELQWLYETLEANRNKRCFLFQHIPPLECSGDVLSLYPYTKLGSDNEALVFKSLLKHYRNVVYFHGHTHMKYYLQKYGDYANYDSTFGCHSIHIPSLSVPRDVANLGKDYETIYADSEGYVVDVYDNGIHLRGRDFVKGEFLPIASYWLDTTLQYVEANTYTDSTGTLQTLSKGE